VRGQLEAGLFRLLLGALQRLLLRGEGGLTPSEILGDELARDVVVHVHGLLAHEDQVGLLLLDDLLEEPRDAVAIDEGIALDGGEDLHSWAPVSYVICWRGRAPAIRKARRRSS